MDGNYPYIDDIDSVLERLGGNEILLRRLLGKFHDTYGDSRGRFLQCLDAKDYEEAYRIIHSIKGVSANLGLGKLYRFAILLESRMKAEDYDGAMPDVLAFFTELDAVVRSIAFPVS